MTELTIYDPSIDDKRPATQNDIDRLIKISWAYWHTRNLLRTIGYQGQGEIWIDNQLDLVKRLEEVTRQPAILNEQ